MPANCSQDLKSAGIPTGLVTMSLRRMALTVVDLIDFDAFDVVDRRR